MTNRAPASPPRRAVRVALELAVAGAALVFGFLPTPPQAVERWFSTGIYPPIQRAITPASNLAPFALFDLLALAVIAVAGVALVRATRHALRARHVSPLLRTIGHLAAAIGVGYLVFLLLWGFNYRRVPMMERLLVDRAAPSNDAVARLGLEAVKQMNALYGEAHRTGWRGEEWRDPTLRRPFETVQRLLSDAPLAEPGRLKWTMLGQYFRWTGVDGMLNPFGLEVLANPDLLPFERPFVAAHEWSHLAGYADEAEANFVGWLTCIRADVPAQYSGWLYLYWQVNGEIDSTARAALRDAMAAGPRADVDAIIARLRRAQLPWLRSAGWAVYDQYLKANRVEAGVRSYGAVVTLILQARFEDGWTPVRREAAEVPRPPGS